MADLLTEKLEHTTILTLNRPERMNALGKQLRADIADAVQEFNDDPSQYVCILTGTGDKAFCAGADLKETASDAAAGTRAPIAPGPDMYGLATCEKVTIAAINGLAIGGGLELAISCDIRIACDEAFFSMPEVRRGFLGGVAVNVLPRLIPIGAVMDLMLCGGRLSAQDAYRLGLIEQLVPQDQVLETAIAKADAIAEHSQSAVWGTKKVIKFWRDALLTEQHRYYDAVIHRVLLSGDFHEGPKAFVEKRDPVFSKSWPSPFDTP